MLCPGDLVRYHDDVTFIYPSAPIVDLHVGLVAHARIRNTVNDTALVVAVTACRSSVLITDGTFMGWVIKQSIEACT